MCRLILLHGDLVLASDGTAVLHNVLAPLLLLHFVLVEFRSRGGDEDAWRARTRLTMLWGVRLVDVYPSW